MKQREGERGRKNMRKKFKKNGREREKEIKGEKKYIIFDAR